jgi:hypothetical protein
MNDYTLSRREMLKRVVGLSIALSALEMPAFAATPTRGLGTDPNLLAKEIPWPLVLTEAEMKTVKVLGDIMIPADENGPAASAVGVPEFINEWMSAPYEQQQADLELLRKGLTWLDAEAKKRFEKPFVGLTADQQVAIIDDIMKDGSEARKEAYPFFRMFRDRVAGGYYSTPAGWKAIGYIGNVAMVEYPGPPPEVLKHLGL